MTRHRTRFARGETVTSTSGQAAKLSRQFLFGGSKMSGIGSELGEEGLKEFTQLKIVAVAKEAFA